MNSPYVRKLNLDGDVQNPITKSKPYFHSEPNRRERRKILQPHPLFGCGKSVPLTVLANAKYLRYRQVILLKNGVRKTIEHYLPR